MRFVFRVGSGGGLGGGGGWSEWVGQGWMGQRQCPWWRWSGQVDRSATPC